MKIRLDVMCFLGVAFTLGLVVGLLVRLPGVVAPGAGESPDPLDLHTRELARAWPPLQHSAYDSQTGFGYGMYRENITWHQQNKSHFENDDDFKGSSVNHLQKKIQHIHDTIKELKADHDLSIQQVAEPSENSKLPPDGYKKPRNGRRRVLGTNRATVKVYKKQFDKPSHLDDKDRPPLQDISVNLTDSGAWYQSGLFRTLSDVVQGIYWNAKLESLVDPGFSEKDVQVWRKTVEENSVRSLQEGCGRMQNREVRLGEVRACARYRINSDQMQGEIYSFYLSRLLGIPNVPPSVLSLPDPKRHLWRAVAADMQRAKWNPDKVVLLTPWVSHLGPTYIPRELRKPSGVLSNSAGLIHNRSVAELGELVQWSDLIVFDYLTANVDRAVNNLFNEQWNRAMMSSPAHNLEKSTKSNLLVFLDNESGLFHSYRLLDKYSGYHRRLLNSLCVFRKSTAEAIIKFHETNSVGSELQKLFMKSEPLYYMLPRMSDKNMEILQNRVSDVYHHIEKCKTLLQS